MAASVRRIGVLEDAVLAEMLAQQQKKTVDVRNGVVTSVADENMAIGGARSFGHRTGGVDGPILRDLQDRRFGAWGGASAGRPSRDQERR